MKKELKKHGLKKLAKRLPEFGRKDVKTPKSANYDRL